MQPNDSPNSATNVEGGEPGAGNAARILPYNPAPLGQPESRSQSRGPSACMIMAATFAVLALSCMLLAYGTLQGGLDGISKLRGLVPSLGITLVTTPTVTIDVSRPSVIQSVRALSKLESVHYQLEKVVSGKSSGPLFDFLTSDKILLVAHGEVVAGVDLGKLRSQDITVVGDSVTIKLPESEILSSKLDNNKTYVYDRQTGIFSKPDPNLESQIRQAAEQQIVQAATEDGILDKARQNAENTIRTLVKGLGYGDVQFKEGP